MERLDSLSKLSVVFIAIVVLFATLDHLESIAAPLALALTAGVVLSPLSDFWEERGYSPVVGALLGLAFSLILISALTLLLQPLVAQLMEQAPKVWADMQDIVRLIKRLMKGVSEITDEVKTAVAPGAQAAPAASDEAAAVPMPTVTDALLVAPAILSQVLIFSGVLFFFLLSRREMYDWVALHLSGKGNRAKMALTLRRAERLVARYFMTISVINMALGAATGTMLQLMGMPGAALWGVIAFVMNFVVYLGPTIFAFILLFAGVAVFDGWMAIAPAMGFLLLNTLEGQFVTPALIGRNMQLNPLLVFLSLIFGIWLWGPIGGIVAIPLVLWVMVLTSGDSSFGAVEKPKAAT